MRAPEFWSRRPGDPGALARLLGPAAQIWAACVARRLAAGAPYRAQIPVICVGGLTAGGAGKTPTALALATRLIARGRAPHFVSRGHGGTERGPHLVAPERDGARRVGDEALLLAALAPTWVARDRAAAVRAAEAAGAEVVIMDDGHQNPGVAKDLSIVVVDAEAGFGNGRVMPAGPLREPVAAGLARAGAVVLVGDGEPDLATGPAPLRARLRPRFTGLSLTGTPVIAFAGIGRPEKFFKTVKSMGAALERCVAFPDHHRYPALTLQRLAADAARTGATLVTTEKDAARFPPWFRGKAVTVSVELVFDDEAAAEALLDRLFAAAAGA